MHRTLPLSLALLLAGCFSAPPAADPYRLIGPANAIRAECASQPTHLAQEQCANPRILALYASGGNTPPDIIAAYMARREVIAEKMDKGQITETEGAAEMAEARETANAQALRRAPHTAICTDVGGAIICR